MKLRFPLAVLSVAALGLMFLGCWPESGATAVEVDQEHLLPASLTGLTDELQERRLYVVWAPEMTSCSVCNQPVSQALTRFAAEFPEAAVLTAVASDGSFPDHLVVGDRMVVNEPGASQAHLHQGPNEGPRPYVAVLDADRRLLAWRRIPEMGRQDELLYQELLGAYSLTSPVE